MRRQKARRPLREDEGCHSQQTCRRVRTIHHHEQEMLISPHVSETLVHWHTLLQDFLHRALTSVIFVGHGRTIGSTKGRKRTTTGFRQAEKSGETVVSKDVVEAETTNRYLKP